MNNRIKTQLDKYDPDELMCNALQTYFLESGLDTTSYFEDEFAISFLGKNIYLPNPPERQNGIRIHDLNHILLGYKTDFFSESEIGAYELGAGIPQTYVAAWFFNCNSAFVGMFHSPSRVIKAYARGRASRQSLYNMIRYADISHYEEVMTTKVGVMRDFISAPLEAPIKATDLPKLALGCLAGAFLTPVILGGISFNIAKVYALAAISKIAKIFKRK